MKKILTLLLTITVILGLASCGFISNPSDKPDTGNPPSDDSQKEEDPPENELSVIESVTLSNAKTIFTFGEDFDAEDLVVTASMSDGTKKVLDKTDYTVLCEEFNSMKPSEYEVTVRIPDTEISKTYNVTVSAADKLKVLMIGNSYADDTINYAYEIAKSIGIPEENILIADIYIGGCSIATHWQNVLNNEPAYRFGLEREGWFDGTSYTGWTMDEAIMYTDWDFITLQQNSGNSGIASTYRHLESLMNYVLDLATDSINNPNANPNVKLVWHQTWAYQNGSTSSAFAGYGNNQMTMFNAIMSCLESQVLPKEFAAIIPNGTAIQNARTSFIGDTFSRDEHNHLSYDAGRYIAALNMVTTLTGRDPATVNWKPTDSGFEFKMSDDMISVCKESVINAIASPFEITSSKHLVESTPTDDEIKLEGQGTKENPYLIQTAEDMIYLSDITLGADYGNSNLYFKLTADINLGTESWRPICASSSVGWVGTANSFNANFDGNGKTVTFVGHYTGDTWAKGLFSAVGGHVHDLTLRGEITSETGRIGSLASMAMAGAKIENITSYVNITAKNNQIGGIIGYIAAPNVSITNCKNYGSITGRELVGGIVGGTWQNVTYTNCENHGNVTAINLRAGGIVAEKHAGAALIGCASYGTVTAGGREASTDVGSASNYAGYLIGQEY